MGSNHMHDLFRKVFNEPDKFEINEDTGEIDLTGDTLPLSQDMWIGDNGPTSEE